MPKRRFTRRHTALAVALIGVLGLLFLAASRLHDRRLPDIATRVADTSTWDTNADPESNFGYYWLSNQEVLFGRASPDQSNFSDDTEQYFRYDTRAKTDTSLTAFTELMHKTGGVSSTLNPSPNGRWVLWVGMDVNKKGIVEHEYLYSAGMDGSDFRRWRNKSEPRLFQLVWMADSRHWISDWDLPNSADALIRDMEHPKTTQTIVAILGNAGCYASEIIANGHYYGLLIEDTVGGTVTMDETSLSKTSPYARRNSITLPEGKIAVQGVISPQGDRIGWLLRYRRVPPLLKIIRKIFPAFPDRSYYVIGLWISDMDGSHPREVGYVETRYTTSALTPATGVYEARSDEPQGLKWLPNGKRLSFIYKSGLYTVPAD